MFSQYFTNSELEASSKMVWALDKTLLYNEIILEGFVVEWDNMQ